MENADRMQIGAAITDYYIVVIVQHDMGLKRSTYEVLQILSILLIVKIPFRDYPINLIPMISKSN